MPALAGDGVNIERNVQEGVKKENDVSLCLESLRASPLLTPRLGFPGCLCLLQLRKDKSAFLLGGGRALRQVYTERGEPGS